MGSALTSMTVRGFKSIQALEDFELRNLNVLIGANGAGKSNFVDFFRLLRAIVDQGLQGFLNQQGGGDGFFFLGPKATPQIHARVTFGLNVYEFDLKSTADSRLMFDAERVQYTRGGNLRVIGEGCLESRLKDLQGEKNSFGTGHGVPWYVYDAVSSWMVYHFHDTSMLAPMRRDQSARDFEQLRPDAANIAAFLLRLREKHADSYALILDAVRRIAPFFDDFLLRPEERGEEEKVRLEWRQRGSDFPFQAGHLSDGTLRFICLTTALLQPQPPSAVVIDEPELGLHPSALALLADIIHSASQRTQIVISTQSPMLLDYFEPADVVVVSREKGQSRFARLDPGDLAEWLNEYSVGELWQKNVVRGGPGHE